MRLNLRPCTRILCLASAALLLVTVPGIILLYVFAGLSDAVFRTVGSALLVLPFFLNTAIMVVVACLVTHSLRRRRLHAMNANTRARALHARRWIWLLTSAWLVYLLVILIVLAAAAGSISPLAITGLSVVCRAGVAFGILMLADGHRRWRACHFDTTTRPTAVPSTTATTRNATSSSSSSTVAGVSVQEGR